MFFVNRALNFTEALLVFACHSFYFLSDVDMRACLLIMGCAASLGVNSMCWAVEQSAPQQTGTNERSSPEKSYFDIYEYSVIGNSVLPVDNIEDVLKPYLGLNKTTDDVDHAREKLEQYYQGKGYKTVQVVIPKQSAQDGVIRLEVREARIGKIEVVGSKYHSLDRIREQAPSLVQGAVPNFNEITKNVQALNASADRQVSPAIRAGETPGTIDVDLVVEDSLPVHGTLELNNRQSPDTSELRSSASLSYSNLWQRNHSLTLSYQTAPKNMDDAKVFYASYLAPFENSNFSLLLNAIRSDSSVSTVGDINVLGNGNILGVRGLWSLRSSSEFYDSVSLGIDRKDFKQQTVLGGDRLESPITYYPVTGGYNAMWRGAQSQTQADISLVFALRPLGSDSGDFDNNRVYSSGQQLSLHAGLNYNFNFKNDMQFQSRIQAQATNQPLISYEQFSAGGADSVRGYYESEAQGDLGLVTGFDLLSPSLMKGQDVRVYGFVDGAVLEVKHPAAETPRYHNLASTGVGLRLNLWDHLEGNISWAKVLRQGPTSDEGDDRVLFRIFASF